MQRPEDFQLFDYLQRSYPSETAGCVSERYVKKGADIYLPGDHQNAMYEITAGAVKLGTYTDDGEEVVYEVLKERDFFGNLKYLEVNQFFEFARALTGATLRAYELAFFKRIIVHDARASEWFNYYIVNRWSQAEKKFFRVNFKDRGARLHHVYERLSTRVTDAEGDTYVLFDLLTKRDLGDLIGSTRQTVSRVLADLQDQGVIPPATAPEPSPPRFRGTARRQGPRSRASADD